MTDLPALFDLTGRVVESGQGTQQHVALYLEQWAAGSYWIRAQDNDAMAVLPLVVAQR